MQKNIKLDRCEEFIYKKISSRVRTQKELYNIACEKKEPNEKEPDKKESKEKITNEKIIPGNPSLASNILNNKRHKKKNPYLITATYFKDVCDNLKFKSQSEMLWGSEKEFKTFGGHFFFLLIDAILSIQSPETEFEELQKCITLLLNDYAPYAKISCYEDFKSTHENIDYDFFDLITYYDIDKPEEERTVYRNAVGRLYSNLASQFVSSFLSFFKEKNTIKLNQKLNMYILNDFSEILQKQLETNAYSIGKLVYDSLKAYYELIPSETEFYFFELGYHHTFTSDTQEDLEDVLKDLRKANSDYIDKLVKIQARLEFTSYEVYLVDKWDYHNFAFVEDN